MDHNSALTNSVEQLLEPGSLNLNRRDCLESDGQIHEPVGAEDVHDETSQSHTHASLSETLPRSDDEGLLKQFEQSDNNEHLEATISLHQEALDLRPAPHPDRAAYLTDLGEALETRFEKSGQQDDLDSAISLFREALDLRPAPYPDRSFSLHNLANALQIRFEQSGQEEDLEAVILLNREALDLLPAQYPGRSSSLNNLARALRTRFKQSDQFDDLEEAITSSNDALDLLFPGHPSTCSFLATLGLTFMTAYAHTNDPQYLLRAMDAFRNSVACASAPPSERFHVAKEWATLAGDRRHTSALEAYQAAIELLPHLAMLGLDVSSRQTASTSGSDGLAREAAACAIGLGKYERAVELLEEGRVVLWSQALQLRAPMDFLRVVAPELGRKLRDISLALEHDSLQDVSRDMSDNPQQVVSMEREAARQRRLNYAWLATLEEVRQLKGFENFLLPQRLSKLQGAAEKGPVVILNASKGGNAALILTSNGVQHVPLKLTKANVDCLMKLLQTATVPGSQDPEYSKSIHTDIEDLLREMPLGSKALQLLQSRVTTLVSGCINSGYIFRYVLASLWVFVITPVFHSLGLEKSDAPPNLWWCPTGLFAFLPLHAAGMYNVQKPACVSDYVVSSYTPTINALMGNMPDSGPFKMMAVIEPNTPGQSSLPYTVDELERIRRHVPAKDLITLESTKVEEVVSHLSTVTIAHFACHGHRHPRDPLENSLVLHHGPLKVSQILRGRTGNARLAFLCACQTAMGDENLADEMIHIASTLLFAGFPGVVGTMWSISDVDGPEVADTFYEYLFRHSEPTTAHTFRHDTIEAARALHHAVIKLRSEGVPFMRWVPFVHMGR